MRGRALPIVLGILLVVLIIGGVIYNQTMKNEAVQASPQTVASALPLTPSPSAEPSPAVSSSPSPGPSSSITSNHGQPDLTVDSNGLSHTTILMNTTQGVIKFKFYPQDAPNTVNRIIELIQKGFYNGLTFHRVVPGFVIQGGDPTGTGTGGSGKTLKAEFNNRHHVEGTVAMARATDPDSADSQFYISLGTHPHLDHQYTVFGQVVEGMDAAKKIQVGDKMTSVTIQ